MEKKHVMGATALNIVIVCVVTLLHVVVRPKQDGLVQAFTAAPLQRTRSRHDSGSLRFAQQTCRHGGPAGVTALNMAGFWGRPPLEEVSVLELPGLRQGSDDVAVVYYTACDLRVHDHDGLVAAAKAARVLPVYVFDDQVCRSVFWCKLFIWAG